ncbi:HAD family hydrolase [Microbacterium sp. Marseille-Q6965]|uniref:HAD family hydrolase n=1 Tax=Microbacterium sp. Marseille-Q6965 TaxID=2965072 RepID=UPI0021B71A7F|nr:HAD family hydrolase [Microbacterium sp. Marseille-Q6965]
MIGRTLILDFDGTVCVGHGPALAYAREASGLHADLADLPDRVARYCAGEQVPGLEGALDGYLAVADAAIALGVPVSRLQAAFLEARRQLAEDGLGTRAPEGLAALTDELRADGTRVLLVTNAPEVGLDRMLARLGLADSFDEVVAEARKPSGLGDVIDRLGHPVSKDRVLSVGDIWVNDLAVPAERGAATALIDPFGRAAGTPDVRARSFEELLPFLREWGGRPLHP